jgi:NADPH2:quinone reductase
MTATQGLMKAIRFHRLGGPEVVVAEEMPRPVPGPGTVLVHNAVMGVNFGDLAFLRGTYLVRPKLPDIPGMEAAGTIIALGPEVSGLSVGQRVAYIGLGAFAEYSTVKANRILPLADHVSLEQGAAFPIASLTAWHMLHTVHRLEPGQTVLVHSAAGGVGMAAVQLAKAAGARVIGTVSSAEKETAAREVGADDVIDYAATDFAAETLRLTDGQGVDLILDGVGAPTFEDGLNVLSPFGHMILFGSAGGPPGPIDPRRLFARSLTVSAFVLPMLYRNQAAMQRSLDDIYSLLNQGRFHLPIHSVRPVAEAGAALTAIGSRATIGKLLLTQT